MRSEKNSDDPEEEMAKGENEKRVAGEVGGMLEENAVIKPRKREGIRKLEVPNRANRIWTKKHHWIQLQSKRDNI